MSKPLPRLASSWFTAFDLARDPLRRPLAYFERLGDTFGGRLFGKDFIITRCPEVFEDVLVKQHKSFVKDDITRGLGRLLGNGLLISEGDTWKKSRRIIVPHLQPRAIERHLEIFREEAERTIAAWPSGGTVDLHQQMTELTLRVLLRSVFGTDARETDDFERSMRDVMQYFAGFANTSYPLPLWLPTSPNRRFRRAREHLNRALEGILASARNAPAGVSSVLHSMFSARESGELGEQQLLDECLTFLLAGHETTALALTYTLGLLGDAPGEQTKLRSELERLPPPNTLAALRGHHGLVRVIKESMRLYPESWTLGREALEAVEVGGWAIERQTQVYLYQWAAHQNPRWFARPERFEPERWTPDFEAALPRSAYIPFGGGPRICVGNHFAWAELVSMLATIVGRVELQPVQPFRPRLLMSVVARPRDPVPMRVVHVTAPARVTAGAA
jgi:cytochrome P450